MFVVLKYTDYRHSMILVLIPMQYIMGMIEARYNWICQPVIYSYEPEHMRVSQQRSAS